jgi:UDP-GlcNAc:undecaprenyl-phosphate GlcNAc-1-phosphate transferase
MILFSTFLISTICTILVMPFIINLACRLNVLDLPNSRKIHCEPVPRIGGVAMTLGAFIPILLWAPSNNFVKSLLFGSGILVIFGIVDDIRNISFKVKFAGQIIAALIVVSYGGLNIHHIGILAPNGVFLPAWVSIPLTIVIIVAVTNAINFSDGLDGLAGGLTLITFLCLGYLSHLGNLQAYEIISVAMVGAVVGFLRFNTHPAVIFMGDSGSQLLGFVAISISLALTKTSGHPSLSLVPLIIGIPLVDALFVMFQRIFEGRSPFLADKCHLHHKLMNLGLYHSESVLAIYLLHSILVCMAFIFRFKSAWFLSTLYISYSGCILAAIFIAYRNGWQIKRYDIIDLVIKGNLRKLREKNILIKISFKSVEIGFIFLLIFNCFLPLHIHIYFSLFTTVLLIMVLLTRQFKKDWVSKLLDMTVFMMIPFLVYFSEKNVGYLVDTFLIQAYNISFGILFIFVVLTLKFTRRNGFKPNPMDFLLIFIALVIPNLPDPNIKEWQMGLIAAKIIVFFFSYEIIKGELRFELKNLEITSIAVLLIISARGLIG